MFLIVIVIMSSSSRRRSSKSITTIITTIIVTIISSSSSSSPQEAQVEHLERRDCREREVRITSVDDNVYIYIYIHIYSHTYIYIYIYIYIYSLASVDDGGSGQSAMGSTLRRRGAKNRSPVSSISITSCLLTMSIIMISSSSSNTMF